MRVVKIILSVFVIVSVSACVLMGPSRTVPQANYKLAINEDLPKPRVLEIVEQVLAEQGLQPTATGWEDYSSGSGGNHFDELKQFRRYQLNDIEVSYYPHSAEYIRLSYYEHGPGRFSVPAIELYYSIRRALVDAGLQHLPETADDIAASKPVRSPEQFNENSDYSAWGYYVEWSLGVVLALGIYTIIIFFPLWMLLRRMLSKLDWSLKAKRAVFIAVATGLFYPTIVPLSMFGPILLVPGIIPAPLLLWSATELREVILISIMVTLIISAAASLIYIKQKHDAT